MTNDFLQLFFDNYVSNFSAFKYFSTQGQGPDVGLCIQGGPNPGPHIEGGHGVLYTPLKLSVYVICQDSQGTTI